MKHGTDDSSSSSSNELDSDDEGIAWKRKRMVLPNEPTPMAIDTPQNAAFNTAATAYVEKKKKVNNIWGQVIQEEQMADLFKGVEVDDSINCEGLLDRGCETYPIAHLNSKKRNRNVLNSRQERGRKNAEERHQKFKLEDSDLSSGGLSDESKAYLRRDKRIDPIRPALSLQSKTKTQRDIHVHKKMREAMSSKLQDMNDMDLGNYIASKLREDKKDILHRTIQFLGREVAIKVFKKTMKIEASGGLLIKKQQRRRTPGGVYFYLLKGYKTFPADKVDQVFLLERKSMSEAAKKKKQAKTYEKKRKMKALKKKLAEEEEEGEIKGSDDNQMIIVENQNA